MHHSQVLLISCIWGAVVTGNPVPKVLLQETIDHINNIQSHWKAGHNFKLGTTTQHVKGLLGVPTGYRSRLPIQHWKIDADSIPDTFDARDQWPDCPTIQEIRDQGSCGCCWAFAAVEAISDRICIHSNAQDKPHISAEDLLGCCNLSCGSGCNGGYPDSAWDYWVNNGIVTGGNYDSNDGCQPYTIASCDHYVNGTLPECQDTAFTPLCKPICISGYNMSYNEDKHFGKNAYGVSPLVDQIQTEILTNGPVEASYDVFEDFLAYKSGVYRYISGAYIGGHAVKIIGWGTENDDPYWLIANSWNDEWGDMGQSFFFLIYSNYKL